MNNDSQAASQLPIQHLSIRVPWHDSGWGGTICQQPGNNASCLILKKVRDDRVDSEEIARAGKSFNELEQSELPACIGERAGFMSSFEMSRTITHPHSAYSPPHKLFKPVRHKHPPYSADCIPFRWMLGDNAEAMAETYDIGLVPELEEKAQELMGFQTNWVENGHNQRAMLDTFYSAVRPEQSLCFFYAKDTPLSEDSRRVIVGVGRVTSVGEPTEYDYESEPTLRAILWERTISHSIRPDFKDGFLLPYHDILELAEADQTIDPEEFVAFAPGDYFTEFSYTTEHVGHDAAIAALLSCAEALRKASAVLPGSQQAKLGWIDDRLNELWSLRGPYPGLGSALRAFGIQHGNFVAYDIARELEENEDPWPLVEQAFEDPELLDSKLGRHLSGTMVKKWQKLPEERKALLKLLSRFDISSAQARRFYDETEREKADIQASDADLLANPYLFYELDRFSPEPITLGIIDRGIFPDEIVRNKHPLPEPSSLQDDPVEDRRVRAIVVSVLEQAAGQGNTLLPKTRVIEEISEMELQPACDVDKDLLLVVEDFFISMVDKTEMSDGASAYQLSRLTEVGDVIRRSVERRLKGSDLHVEADWRARLDQELEESVREGDLAEESARSEKVVALEKLASSRISVLIGPAGTGKTTLLSVLAEHPQIKGGDVKLLAPTGKARVQLEQKTKIPTQTIAQFLLKLGGFDPNTGRHLLSNRQKVEVGKTLIIDEASMLTEEQLAAVLHIVRGVERLILVGDYRQLPPIGSGRPFVDIVNKLAPKDSQVSQSFAELTVQRRQVEPDEAGKTDTTEANGNDSESVQNQDLKGSARDDLLLAGWFSGDSLGAGSDETWDRIRSGEESPTLRFVSWKDGDDLHAKLPDVLAEELGLEHRDDAVGFEQSLGGSLHEVSGRVFFWKSNYQDRKGAEKIEAWQILSPVRGQAHGVYDLNRIVQGHYRQEKIEMANAKYRKVPRPFGQEEIVYGDKVMNVANKRRPDVWPEEDALQYVANGEIGIVVGQYKTKNFKRTPWKLQVVLSSQPGSAYGYGAADFSQEGNNLLELAYATTVHKAQGSEFGRTFLILPADSRLSRELLYTALTRQRNKVIILHQGDISDLKRFADPSHSDTAVRLTNLFSPPEIVEIGDRFLENKLIHRTRRGDAVRSKSEVIIADLLYTKGLEDYVYEDRLQAPDGSIRYPDFVIDEAETGQRIYWEHLGMLNDHIYRKRWERKLKWYREQDILPHEEGGGSGGSLVVTKDDEHGGIDSGEIEQLVAEVFGL